jgi:hypothetical protein
VSIFAENRFLLPFRRNFEITIALRSPPTVMMSGFLDFLKQIAASIAPERPRGARKAVSVSPVQSGAVVYGDHREAE